MTTGGKAGFSVLEAIVVLMIAGAALLLVFQIGVRGSETGFRLGRRALATADAEPGTDSFRAIIRGLALSAATDDRSRRRIAATPSISGDARGFAAASNLDRATVCAPAGPTGRLKIRLQATPEGDLLTCVAGQGSAHTLIDLRPATGRFGYSTDGVTWRDAPPLQNTDRRLQVRLSATDGSLDIVEQAAPASVAQPPVIVSGPVQ